MPSTTIGEERRHDPMLAPMDIDAFARALLAGQPAIPPYFARMRPIEPGRPARSSAAACRSRRPSGRPRSPRRSRPAPRSSTRARRRTMPRDTSRAPSRSRSTNPSAPGSGGSWTSTARSRWSSPASTTSSRSCARRSGSAATRSSGSWSVSTPGARPGTRWRRAVASRSPASPGTSAAGGPPSALAHRRPPGVRVRDRPRPGRLAHPRRLPGRPSRRAAAGPADRDDVRRRIPGVDRGVAPARRRLRARRLGRERVPGMGRRRLSGRARIGRGTRPRLTPDAAGRRSRRLRRRPGRWYVRTGDLGTSGRPVVAGSPDATMPA